MQDVEVAEGRLFDVALVHLLDVALFLALLLIADALLSVAVRLPGLGVGEVDLLGVLGEINHHEGQGLAFLGRGFVGLLEVAVERKALDVVREHHGGALVGQTGDGALVLGTDGEDGLLDIPRVLLQLLVA